MKEMFERVIALKNYDLKTLLANIDQYHMLVFRWIPNG